MQSESLLPITTLHSFYSFFPLLSVGTTLIGGVFPVEGLVLFVSVAVAILVAFTSTNDKPPVYHCVSTSNYVHCTSFFHCIFLHLLLCVWVGVCLGRICRLCDVDIHSCQRDCQSSPGKVIIKVICSFTVSESHQIKWALWKVPPLEKWISVHDCVFCLP